MVYSMSINVTTSPVVVALPVNDSRAIPSVIALVVAFVGMSSLVSFSNVFRNMPSLLEFGSIYNFTSSAIVHTEFSVQLVLGAVVIIGALLIRDTIKNFSYSAKLVKSYQVES